MKVALVFPNYLENFFLITSSFQQNLGLAMIAAVLKKAGHEVHVIDATAERLNIRRLEKRVGLIDPDIIGISANVSFARKAIITGKWLKIMFPRAKVIFGGPWPTVDYEYLLQNGAADYVVIGEGESTIVDLLKSIDMRMPEMDVKGIAFKSGGDIIKTGPRDLITDLDSLPFPAWELFPSPRRYFSNMKGKRFYPICASRGCPFGCIYCSKMVHGYKIRTRSIKNIIEEIKYLKKNYGMDEIIFTDDNFNFDVTRAEQLCDEILNLDFQFSIAFFNGVRADKLPPRLAWKLRQAGAYDISLGIECGDQDIVYQIGKQLDLNKVRYTTKMLKKLLFFIQGFFMVGLPGENIRTMIETKRLAIELDLDMPHFFKVIPFPGTKLYQIIEENGKFLIDMKKNMSFYHFAKPTYELDGLPHELIDLAIQDMNRSFFLRPKKILLYLRKMRLKNIKWHLNFLLVILTTIYTKKRSKDHTDLKRIIIEKIRRSQAPIRGFTLVNYDV